MKKEELQHLAFMANFEATKCWQMSEPWLSLPADEKEKLARFVKESNIVVTAIQATLALVYKKPFKVFEIDVQKMRDGGMSDEQMTEHLKLMDELELPAIKLMKEIYK